MELMMEIGIAETREHVNALNERLIAGVDELGGVVVTPRDAAHRGALVCIRSTDAPAARQRCSARTGSSPRSATTTSASRPTPTTRPTTSTTFCLDDGASTADRVRHLIDTCTQWI